MIRLATRADLTHLLEIRDGAGDDPLADPSAVGEAQAASLIDDAALWVWQEAAGPIAGFAGIDHRDGSVWALLVAPGHEGKGIGRALLQTACDALRAFGHDTVTLRLGPRSRAERHYLADGWTEVGLGPKGELIFRKPL